MRVLQLIDSLDAGGAERMAVNLSNALVSKIDRSYICATRREGLLKMSIHNNVFYLFLKKRSVIDIGAIKRLYFFLKREEIDIIHAHSSSYFLAVLVSRLLPKIKVVWHDHYGNSDFLSERPRRMIKFCSQYFSYSFAVNKSLVIWAKRHLKHKSVNFLPNFVDIKTTIEQQDLLKGQKGSRIICLANLRSQKDHINLIQAFNKLVKNFPEYTLHCVGQDFGDAYANSIYRLISDLELSKSVFFYGSCTGVPAILSDCDIGVLASKSEGLPLALLEYGRARLPVVVTDVGDCAHVVENELSGIVVVPEDSDALFNGLGRVIFHIQKGQQLGENLNKTIRNTYSTDAVIDKVIKSYKTLWVG